jgi:hypothetical protein
MLRYKQIVSRKRLSVRDLLPEDRREYEILNKAATHSDKYFFYEKGKDSEQLAVRPP